MEKSQVSKNIFKVMSETEQSNGCRNGACVRATIEEMRTIFVSCITVVEGTHL